MAAFLLNDVPFGGGSNYAVDGDAYNPTTGTYEVGDFAIQDNTLYKCKTAISTPEVFDPAKWDRTNISSELKDISSDLSEKTQWKLIASVSGNNVKTAQQLLNELYAASNFDITVGYKYVLVLNGVYVLHSCGNGYFSQVLDQGAIVHRLVYLNSSSSSIGEANGSFTITYSTYSVLSPGASFTLYMID